MPATYAVEPITIAEQVIAPGERAIVRVPVGQLPSGNLINIHAHVFRTREPGPTVLLLGGVHGDEINGVEIVRQSIAEGIYNDLRCGTVIAIPLLNIYGFINFSRDVPDGKDVNRAFPGSAGGSLAARVAHTLNQQILPYIDFGVDFHTGGGGNYNYPQVRFTHELPRAEELARAFGAPIMIANRPINKTLRRVAMQHHDAPIIVFEGGENLRYDTHSIQHGLAGIRRLLHAHAMLADAPPAEPLRYFNKTTWLRANLPGLFQWMVCSGNEIRKGQVIGVINDPHGINEPRYIYAPRDSFIIGQNNAPVVSLGDALFHLAYYTDNPDPAEPPEEERLEERV